MIRKSDMVKSTIIAIVTIIACIGIVTAGTLALFTDSMLVENHLEAGTLDVTLHRTYLERTALDDDGYLYEFPDDNRVVDYTNENTENVLGLKTGEIIVPGLNCRATLKIAHGPKSNIAFNYIVKLVVKGDATGAMNELGEQLMFYAEADGVVYEKTLDQVGSDGYVIMTGALDEGASSEEFVFGLKFIDFDAGPNPDAVKGTTNNKAQSKNFYFDIIVEAVQGKR